MKTLKLYSNSENSIEVWAKSIKTPLKIRHWRLKNKERKRDFRFVERKFLAAINRTGGAEVALVPVPLRITRWTKSGLPVSPPGLFPPCLKGCRTLDDSLSWDCRFLSGSNRTLADFLSRLTAFRPGAESSKIKMAPIPLT